MRRALAWPTLLLAWVTALAAGPVYPPVLPGRSLAFPRDHGAHPEYRTEWWYVTGWLETGGAPLGFQITFFRSRPPLDEANPSRFAPKQLLFAHVAVSDPKVGHLLHEQRAQRAGFGLAEARTDDTGVHIDDWSLTRAATGAYTVRIPAGEIGIELTLTPTQPPMRQGDAGYSRKGPLPAQASYYYSQPQLKTQGSITRAGRTEPVRGTAWLDHEWSTTVLAQEAVGWDWLGINLDDGGALMGFRIRDSAGRTLWSHAQRRRGDGSPAAAAGFSLAPLRIWRSPRTGAAYPVALRVRAGDLAFDLLPLQDDQELDARASTGAVYWEGAVTALSAGKRVGRGYLELTGYFRPLKL